MKNFKLFLALLIAIAFGTTVSVLHRQNSTLVHQLNQKDTELTQTQTELQQTKHLLKVAQDKLGYLDKYKATVQVTAYAMTPAFGDNPQFANGRPVHRAYAVKKHKLPEDAIVNVALSASAQRKLNAKLNDLLVIMDKRGRRKTIARFVDTTAPSETRPVVDVYFADAHQARIWGRHYEYVAVNISAANSPFRQY